MDGDDDSQQLELQSYSADFQLPLPPLAAEDAEFLRAVAARAAAAASTSSSPAAAPSSAHHSPLRALIAAYNAEAAARGTQHGLAPVYQGYLLRMSDGASVDELVAEAGGSGSQDGAKGRRKAQQRAGKL